MGWLEDAGRGNAFSPINNVLGKAIDMRHQENTDSMNALGKAIDLGQLGIQKAASEREATKFRYAEHEMKVKEAADNTPVPVSSVWGPDYNTNPAKKTQIEYAKKNGMITEPYPGVLMTTARNAREYKKTAAEDVAHYKFVEEQAIQYTNTQLNDVTAAMAGDKEALDRVGVKKPEELAALKDKYSKQLSEQVSAAKAIDLEHQKKLSLEEAKSKTSDWQTIKDEDSPTGWSKINEKLGEVVQGVAPPASAVAEKRADTYEKKRKDQDRHNKVIEALKKVNNSGDKKTALMMNTNFLVENGWDKKSAMDMLTSSKPVSKDTFIAQATLAISKNDMIPEEEKFGRIQNSIQAYDLFIGASKNKPTTPTVGKVLDAEMAAAILKEAGGDKNKAREIAKQRKYKF